MAQRDEGRPAGRFSKSGHTKHASRAAGPGDPARGPNRPNEDVRDTSRYTGPGGGHPPVDDFGNPTYHHTPAERAADARATRPAAGLTRSAVTHTNHAARVVTRKVISASKADGASESGLTALIWNQVLSYGADAMITVALAGTVFFGASAHAQRGNVLLYLLVTMAPFAVVAPVIGPVLDRFQHGRRWTMAGTAVGRAVLAVIMAGHPSELLVLYPCALGSLVLSKAYSVVRAAAAPRLVPRGLTLTEANARLSIFGLGSTMVLGASVGVVIKLSGSYSLGLYVTAVGFAATAAFAVRLPAQIDSSVAAQRHPGEAPRPRRQRDVPPLSRLLGWARRGFDPHLITALQGESALRLLSGMLTIYLAFYVEATSHGVAAALGLGAVIAAAGAGNFVGTAIGTKVKMHRPELVIIGATAVAAAVCLLVAMVFDLTFAVVAMLISAILNALCKIALDSLIQRDVPETLRSRAFARSETFLQLAWVLGAAIGVGLPVAADGGAVGFWTAGGILAAVAAVVLLRNRAIQLGQRRADHERAAGPGPQHEPGTGAPPGSLPGVPKHPGSV